MSFTAAIPFASTILNQLARFIPGVQKTYDFVTANYYLIQSCCIFGLGAKEAAFDRKWSKIPSDEVSSDSCWTAIYTVLLKSHKQAQEFFTLHSALLLGSGAFGIGYAIFGIGLFTALSEGLFVLASAIAARYYVEMFASAGTKTEKAIAILGFLSSIGYILAAALFLTGVPACIPLLVCCLAVSTGGLRMLVEFFAEYQYCCKNQD